MLQACKVIASYKALKSLTDADRAAQMRLVISCLSDSDLYLRMSACNALAVLSRAEKCKLQLRCTAQKRAQSAGFGLCD
jgi:hypothetical protein